MRLIDAEPIILMLKETRKLADSPRRDLDILNLQQMIELEPIVDAVPVVYGHLSSTGYDEQYCEFGNCSICQKDNPMYSRYYWFCGAKMDVEVAGNDS